MPGAANIEAHSRPWIVSRPRADLVDRLLGVSPGSRLDRLRRSDPSSRRAAQAGYERTFAPADAGPVSLLERLALATFIAGLHNQMVLSHHYEAGLVEVDGGPGLAGVINAEIERAHSAQGLSERARAFLGTRLAAAFEHAHFEIFGPRPAMEAKKEHLIEAGWPEEALPLLSNLVAFVRAQVRLVEDLTILVEQHVSEEDAMPERRLATFSLAVGAMW